MHIGKGKIVPYPWKVKPQEKKMRDNRMLKIMKDIFHNPQTKQFFTRTWGCRDRRFACLMPDNISHQLYPQEPNIIKKNCLTVSLYIRKPTYDSNLTIPYQ